LVVAEGKKRGTLYTLKSKLQKEDIVATATKEDPTTNLWHKILGHLTERGLKILAEQKPFPRIKRAEFKLCEHCIMGRQERVSFIRDRPKRDTLGTF
jgi:hypothetical protein